jgi:hypothetical protein
MKIEAAPAVPEYVKAFTEGYGLDGGGYEFEWVGSPMAEAMVEEGLDSSDAGVMLAWDEPDWDYFPFSDEPRDGGLCHTLLIVPNDGHYPDVDWPESFVVGDHVYVKASEGVVYGSDRECDCCGRLVAWTGAAGEPPECPITPAKLAAWVEEKEFPATKMAIALKTLHLSYENQGWFWEFTGELGGLAYPECPKCEGSGYFDSPGGCWAIYSMEEADEQP